MLNTLAGEYNQIYTRKEHYQGHYSKSPYHRLWREVAKHISPQESVVEIGCGTGQLMELLLDKGTREYIGYDFSEVGLKLAQSRLKGRYARLCYEDLYTITELPDADVYVAVEVFEHLRDDTDIRLLSIIPKGKKIILTLPSYLGGSHVRKFSSAEDITSRYHNIAFNAITSIGQENKIFIVLAEKL